MGIRLFIVLILLKPRKDKETILIEMGVIDISVRPRVDDNDSLHLYNSLKMKRILQK